jgi:hypothetical protein
MIGVFSSVYVFMTPPLEIDSEKLLKTYHE